MKHLLCLFLVCFGAPAASFAENADWKPAVRWRGFNLLGMFFYHSSPGTFAEEDFQMMHDWGFNFARLPMDYRYWIVSNDWEKIDEAKIAPIDQAVAWGKKYG